MQSRNASAIIVAVAAFCVAAPLSEALAQPAVSTAPSPWIMPGNVPAAPATDTPPAPPPSPTVPTSPVATTTAAYAWNPPPPAPPPPALAPPPPASRSFVTVQSTPAPRGETPAQAPPAPRDFHVDVGGGTEVPISVGGLVTAELPHRFLLQLGVGVMPRAYADAIDGFLTSVGAYDAVVSQVVRNSLNDSVVVRASIGGRPFQDHGFEILAGYTLITGGGSVATTDILNAILLESGSTIQAPAGLGPDIPLSATLHNFHASLGWRWLLADDRLVLRASISYIQTVDSRITVKIPESAAEVVPYEGVINEQINAFLGPYFAKYAKAPTLGLSGAFRF